MIWLALVIPVLALPVLRWKFHHKLTVITVLSLFGYPAVLAGSVQWFQKTMHPSMWVFLGVLGGTVAITCVLTIWFVRKDLNPLTKIPTL